MHLQGITFVGTRTAARTAMVEFVRDVLGLAPARIDGIDAAVFALPDGSSFAVTSQNEAAGGERTVGFLVDDVEQAATELRAAGIVTDDEISSSAQQRYIHFRAPDGLLYELVEEIG
jgi:catechol 2,3-dioxygenase-like lactoylglutathione lyase family enzyme